MGTPEQKWVAFDLSVNCFFGTIESSNKWHELIKRYCNNTNGKPEDITKARQVERKEDLCPCFSFKGTGPTLAEWAKKNGIDLHVV